MTTDALADLKDRTAGWFETLRDEICAAFTAIEACHRGPMSDRPAGHFERSAWQRPGGGGGVTAVMRGRVFEKVGVNVSTVYGSLSEEFRTQIPGAVESEGQFWASGISLVAHLHSPLVPAVHMNTRFIATTKAWFGGGADLTPMFPDEDATQSFHAALKAACDGYDPLAYARFKAWCDDYFFLKHRNEPRGAGGIFFDYLDSGDRERDFAFTREVGRAFLAAYPPIVKGRTDRPWSDEQRQHQLVRRGRYVEFNLLYDRGTVFGLKTGGNVEAILMSLPPVATWP